MPHPPWSPDNRGFSMSEGGFPSPVALSRLAKDASFTHRRHFRTVGFERHLEATLSPTVRFERQNPRLHHVF